MDSGPWLHWCWGLVGVVPEDVCVGGESPEELGENGADSHLSPWAWPDHPGWGRLGLCTAGEQKVLESCSGLCEEMKAQQLQLEGDSVRRGVVTASQTTRPGAQLSGSARGRHSLALQSEPSCTRPSQGKNQTSRSTRSWSPGLSTSQADV